MRFLRCGEDFEMGSDLRRGLRSQRWFQTWVLSKISVLFRDRVRDFSEFSKFCWYFRDIGKASGWYHVSAELPGLKGGWRPQFRQKDLCYSKIRLGILQHLHLKSTIGSPENLKKSRQDLQKLGPLEQISDLLDNLWSPSHNLEPLSKAKKNLKDSQPDLRVTQISLTRLKS